MDAAQREEAAPAKPRSAAQLAHDKRLKRGDIAKLGGRARAKALTPAQRSAWAALGGRARGRWPRLAIGVDLSRGSLTV